MLERARLEEYSEEGRTESHQKDTRSGNYPAERDRNSKCELGQHGILSDADLQHIKTTLSCDMQPNARSTHVSQIFTPRSPGDWEGYFPIISPLFAILELGELMKIMKENYCFKATVKQYKTKIEQWRREGKLPPKNFKQSEMRAMVRKVRKRQADGKVSEFRYRGWPVDHDKIIRFEARFPHIDYSGGPSTPSCLSCYTPSAHDSPSPEPSDRQEMEISKPPNLVEDIAYRH